MTLEQLVAMGMNEDVAKKVIEEHQKTIKDQYIPISRFNEVNEAKKQLETDLKGRDKQLKDLGSKVKDNEDLTKQINELQEANKKSNSDYETKIKNLTLDSSIKMALKDRKFKHPDLLMGKVDREKLVINQDGTITGLDEQMKVLEETFSDLREQTLAGTPPNNNGESTDGKKDANDLNSALQQHYTE